MLFNDHSKLKGLHAFLSPSNYHWLGYDQDKLERAYVASMAAKRGTELHAFAHEAIRLGVKLPSSRKTLNLYVNDGIGFRMETEVTLAYSEHCYGTVDCIAFRNKYLRIHDLKTGVIEASFDQLLIYVALFCLEYRVRPSEIKCELRIYQGDEVRCLEPSPDDIFHVMDKIITFDRYIRAIRLEAL